jgi:hypothetical protein
VNSGDVHVAPPTNVPPRFAVAAIRTEIEPGGLPTAGSYGVDVVQSDAAPPVHEASAPTQPSTSPSNPLPPLG